MSQTYTAVIKRSGDWWIGWIEEVPGVDCQERTREELLDTLRITLTEALELSRREAREAAGDGFEEIPSPYEARGASPASSKAWLCDVAGRRAASVVAQSRPGPTIPRHREIDDHLARKICRDLGVPPVKGA